MKILIISQYFPPEPDLKISGLSEGLSKLGHDVTVVTGFPNYPHGKLYSGYKLRLFQKEQINGVNIIRLPLVADRNRSAFWRALNFLSFMLSTSILIPILYRKPDITWVYFPPLTLGITALIVNLFFRSPYVCEIQDMWPETLEATGFIKNKTALKLIGNIGKLAYKKSSAVTVISDGFKKNIESKGIESSKIHVIHNWAYEKDDYNDFVDINLSKELGFTNYFNILYAGNMGAAQGLTNVISAAEQLTDLRYLQFVMVGTGIEKNDLEKLAKEKRLKNILFLERLPMDKMPLIYALSDALMVHLVDDPLFEITIPGKTQSCLLSGKPVIASVKGDAANLIEKAKAGYAVKPMSPNELALAVRKLYNLTPRERQEMGQAGRQFYFENLSPKVQVQKYEKLFKKIIAENK